MTGPFVADFFEAVESRHHAWPAGRADLHWHLLFDETVVNDTLVEPYCRFALLMSLSRWRWPFSGPRDRTVRRPPV
jgi:hypothetical protein